MAIYGNLNERPMGMHGVAEISLVKASLCGHITDVLLVDDFESKNPIPSDNGVCVKVGDFTNFENGLQERYAVIAGPKDKISFTASVVNIKDARTQLEATEPYFYVRAGEDSKAYEIIGDEYDGGDVIACGLHQFTEATQELAKVRGNYVVLDGTGKYVAMDSKPDLSNYGFVAKIHSHWTNNFYTLVRLYVIQNVDNN